MDFFKDFAWMDLGRRSFAKSILYYTSYTIKVLAHDMDKVQYTKSIIA